MTLFSLSVCFFAFYEKWQSLVEEIKRQFIKQIEDANKQNKALQERLTALTKSSEISQKQSKEQLEAMKKQQEEHAHHHGCGCGHHHEDEHECCCGGHGHDGEHECHCHHE